MTTTPRWTKAFGGAVTGYKTTVAGLAIITHRTYRSSPAGWVWGVHSSDTYTRWTGSRDETGGKLNDPGTVYGGGYGGTRADAYAAAVAWLATPAAEEAFRRADDPIDYYGHACTFDDGEDYNLAPHWWTFASDEDGSSFYVTAPTLRELGQKIGDFHVGAKAA